MKNRNLKILTALICGAAAGSALYVIFSPSKSNSLKKSLAEAGDLKDLLAGKLNKVGELISHLSTKLEK